MTLALFIPAIWSASLLVNLRKRHVYGQPSVSNTDYEGEISAFGDRVKINAIGAVTVFTYTRNTDMPAPETLTDAQLELVIDQAKGFNFQIDDLDARQQKPKLMNAATQEAAYALADVADTFLAGFYTDAGSETGTQAAPLAPLATPGEAYELIVDASVALDELDIPSEGRAAVVPPWFHGLIEKDDRFVKAGTATSDAVLRNGFVGSANGVMIHKSNNVPVVNNGVDDVTKIQVTTPEARSYAEQILKTEAYTPERRFGDALKGLHVYGAKVVRPEAMHVINLRRS